MIRALFGGTFDPIHCGHINTALALLRELNIDRLHLMPNAVPPHRPQPQASSAQRLAMVELACQAHPQLCAEAFELNAEPPSYTVKTLQGFKQRYPDDILLFVMGMDSLVSLDQWYQWQQLTELAHLVVMPRPGYQLQQASPSLLAFINERLCQQPQALRDKPQGAIYLANTPRYDVSATAIREHPQRAAERGDLPAAVAEYIEQHQLYR